MHNITVKEGLLKLYERYDIPSDGGIHDPAVEVRLLKGVTIYIPNVKSRRKVVFRHDVHHLLTGYSAVMKGEIEISAWEISTGCTQNWFAFLINSLGVMTGLPFNFIGVWRAWLRGRTSTNLYSKSYSDQELLSKNVKDLKLELHLDDSEPKINMEGFISFIGFLLFGIVLTIASIALIPFILIYSLMIYLKK